MSFQVSVNQSGGEKLRSVLDEADKRRRKSVKVGFFADARYSLGDEPKRKRKRETEREPTPVAYVAVIQEFGYTGDKAPDIPERPFFRNAISEMNDGLPDLLRGIVDPETMTVDTREANLIGAWAADLVQTSIRELKEPPNADATIERKGSSNPLVDTEYLQSAVTWEVE